MLQGQMSTNDRFHWNLVHILYGSGMQGRPKLLEKFAFQKKKTLPGKGWRPVVLAALEADKRITDRNPGAPQKPSWKGRGGATILPMALVALLLGQRSILHRDSQAFQKTDLWVFLKSSFVLTFIAGCYWRRVGMHKIATKSKSVWLKFSIESRNVEWIHSFCVGGWAHTCGFALYEDNLRSHSSGTSHVVGHRVSH